MTGSIALGLNPYRELDEDYRAFCRSVARHVSTALTDALAYEVERRRAEELTELDAAKTRFLENVSHELRTPLTLILGSLRAIRQEGRAYREDVDTAERGAAAAGTAGRQLAGVRPVRREPAARGPRTHRPGHRDRRRGQHVPRRDRTGRDAAGGADAAAVPAGRGRPGNVGPDRGQPRVERSEVHPVGHHLGRAARGRRWRRAHGDRHWRRCIPRGADPDLPAVHQAPGTLARSREGAGIGLSLVADLATAHRGRLPSTAPSASAARSASGCPWGRP